MCGFAGVLNLNSSIIAKELTPILRVMGNQIAHRGPDDEQLFCNEQVGMIFRRLSIVDLEGGQQPITNEDNSLVLMVNGEIYNHLQIRSLLKKKHTFKTKSDCEIILHLYEEMGIEFLHHLNGMYAIALWDVKKKKLILARDRFGIKPLYYNITKGRIIFGSEIKALMPYPDCPREYDWEKALSFNFDFPPNSSSITSFFKGIEPLPAGNVLVADALSKKIQTQTYWKIEHPSEKEYLSDNRTDKAIIEGYGEILEDSVRLQLMADVELGLFLSGGIDSVTVAMLAARHQKFHTFSVLGQSTFKNGDSRSSHIAAKHFGLNNHQVLYSWHDLPFDSNYWKKLLWLCETHMCEAEQLYKYELHRYAKHTRPDLKIILTGQGSDEFNGGYCHQYIDNVQPDIDKEKRKWSDFEHTLSILERGSFLLENNSKIGGYSAYINKNFLTHLYDRAFREHPWNYYVDVSYRNIQMYNLWHEDRTAAGNSIENRVPFLDHRLIEYTLKVPPKKYEFLFWNKTILRKAFEKYIPKELAQRPKGPFFYGEDVRYTDRMMYNIMTSDKNALLEEAFGEGSPALSVIDKSAIDKLMKGIPEDPEYKQVSTLLTLTNMALLEKTAKETSFKKPDGYTEKIILPSIIVKNWDKEEDDIALKLSIRRKNIDLDSLVAFSDEALFLSDNESNYYISINHTLEYHFDKNENKDWIEVLKRINGKKSINKILSEIKLSPSKIRKQLEEALDYNIINFK